MILTLGTCSVPSVASQITNRQFVLTINPPSPPAVPGPARHLLPAGATSKVRQEERPCEAGRRDGPVGLGSAALAAGPVNDAAGRLNRGLGRRAEVPPQAGPFRPRVAVVAG